MAPKKDKDRKDGNKVGIFNEVERTLLEQQVAECNRKIARLRSVVSEYETRYEELQNAFEKLDEDKADIIAYLKKQLAIKTEEHSELKGKLDGLIELRDIECTQFSKTVSELEHNFTTMKDQLTSENKLLAGKLNTLEEFRSIRDDLMKKYEEQEKKFENQEMSYKRLIYDSEKKNVVDKNKLKKEMEARLLKLAQDFQDATEVRITASTHRVIRDNIAISNELHDILSTQQKLSEQNEMYKGDIRAAAIAKELAEEERDKAISKCIVQLKVIDQLTVAFEKLKKEKGLCEKRKNDFETMQAKIDKLTKENDNLTSQVRILEQHLHAKLCDQSKDRVDGSKVIKERDKLRTILQNASFAVEAALKLDQWVFIDPKQQAMDKQLLLTNLLQIMTQFQETEATESLATIASLNKIYNEGDLGFVPKRDTKRKISKQSAYSYLSCAQKQQSGSFRDYASVTTSSILSFPQSSSLKTIPSNHVLPALPNKEIFEATLSLESLVASTHSTASDEQESVISNDSKTDIEKQLLASKLEIQKSILKDLAFSQISIKKSSQYLPQKTIDSMTSRKSSTSLQRKSVTIVEGDQVSKELQSSVPDSPASESSKEEYFDISTEDTVSEEYTNAETKRNSESETDDKSIRL